MKLNWEILDYFQVLLNIFIENDKNTLHFLGKNFTWEVKRFV